MPDSIGAVTCPQCKKIDWKYLHKSPVNPAEDAFICRCGVKWKRYERNPIPALCPLTEHAPLEWQPLWDAMMSHYDAGSSDWTLTTESMFDEMLNVLPPIEMGNGAFLMCEANHHNSDGWPVYAAFRVRSGNMFEARYMTQKEYREQVR